MANFSRRNFLGLLGSGAAMLIPGHNLFAQQYPAGKFEMLVIGDSLIWGQGLKEENKFYTLTKNWLEEKLKQDINIKIKAHSGARISLHEEEAKALQDAEKADDEFHYPEANLSFPSINKQLEAARKEYSDPESVKLIMLSAGITDINVSSILNPFESNKKLKRQINQYCNQGIYGLLENAAEQFPKALIAVIGYYPMLSMKSDAGKVFNAILELYSFPRGGKSLLNNIFGKQFFKLLHKGMAKRAKIWGENSDLEFNAAIDRFNQSQAKSRAIFIKSPISQENNFGREKSLLWGMAKKGKTNDEIYDERRLGCDKTISEIKKEVKQKFSQRFCELAAIGHPNIEGSKAYAEAIKERLMPLFNEAD
jgi:hypothetical protein